MFNDATLYIPQPPAPHPHPNSNLNQALIQRTTSQFSSHPVVIQNSTPVIQQQIHHPIYYCQQQVQEQPIQVFQYPQQIVQQQQEFQRPVLSKKSATIT